MPTDAITAPAAYYHLPGLFEFYELYKRFFPLYYEHREYFYDWCAIGSVYGAPADCLWGGGRVGYGGNDPRSVAALMRDYSVSARLTFSNSLLGPAHLADRKCNALCDLFAEGPPENGVILCSDLLLDYIRQRWPEYYFVSSTTKVLTDFDDFAAELDWPEYRFVVPDFRLNKRFDRLAALGPAQKDKTEFLCNECCAFDCRTRKQCYEAVSRACLGLPDNGHRCSSPEAAQGYVFSKAMENPAFIGVADIQNLYLPLGFSQFKLEGRSLGSALVLEFLLYYLTKPEYQLKVREQIYLDHSLDLF